jgi:uncharacterized protein YodC (DUF2158 family)
MVFLVSDEVKPKKGGPRMIVTGYSSGMVECRWYDGYGIKREAFREDELKPGMDGKSATRLNHITPGLSGRFYWRVST